MRMDIKRIALARELGECRLFNLAELSSVDQIAMFVHPLTNSRENSDRLFWD
jgi:hypothetical protein